MFYVTVCAVINILLSIYYLLNYILSKNKFSEWRVVSGDYDNISQSDDTQGPNYECQKLFSGDMRGLK